VLTASRLWADEWGCGSIDWDPGQPSCVWIRSTQPDASLPIPVSSPSSAFALGKSRVGSLRLTWFGRHSAASVVQWQQTWPRLDADALSEEYNITQIPFNVSMVSSFPLESPNVKSNFSEAELMAARAGLPLNVTLSEEELNAVDGVYSLGSHWLSFRLRLTSTSYPELIMTSTFHPQPFAFAEHPDNASAWIPQAASSLNTSRPLLNFATRRHSHRMDGLDKQAVTSTGRRLDSFVWLTGGQSGSTFFSDCIEIHSTRCLPPVPRASTQSWARCASQRHRLVVAAMQMDLMAGPGVLCALAPIPNPWCTRSAPWATTASRRLSCHC
jgi:hypothetical protein